MRAILAKSTLRPSRTKHPSCSGGTPGPLMIKQTFRALAIAVAMTVAFFGTVVPVAHADTIDVELVNVGSGLRADVMWASTSLMQGVFLWPNNTSASQEFDTLDSGGGFFRIRARHSGQCLMLDWRGGFYANGTPIIQHSFCDTGYTPSEWSIRQVWSTVSCSQCFRYFRQVLVNRATGRCFDANAPSGHAGEQAVLQQWDCISFAEQWNWANQEWDLRLVHPGPGPIIH